MSMFTCRMCGGVWDIPEGAATAECPHCGTIQAVVSASQDTPEEGSVAAPGLSKSMKMIIAAAALFAVTVLVWYVQVVGPGLRQTAAGVSNMERVPVQAHKMDFEKRVQQGDPWAQYSLGDMYYNGQGVEKDIHEAVNWFRKAAEQGHAEAQFRMGEAYYNGWGVKKNYKEAIKWYQKAASHEIPQAQTALGTMYYNGTGVVRSYFNAVWWYSQAAEKGEVWAQYYLGNMYRNGLGVERNIKKARALYQKASEQGHLGAMKALESTSKMLDYFSKLSSGDNVK